MRRVTLSYKEGLVRGLRASEKTSRDTLMLYEVWGMHPEGEGLATPERLRVVDVSSLSCSFPYPQVFCLRGRVVVCTADSVYELAASALTLKLTGIEPGCLWSAADFYSYVLLYNGKRVIKLDPNSGTWSEDSSLPVGSCVCAAGGQIIVGGFRHKVPRENIDKLDWTWVGAPLKARAVLSGSLT